MESTTSSGGVDLTAGRRTYPGLALAILSVPGSTATWDTLPGGGFVFGAPFAIAALVLGTRARRGAEGRGLATAAIAIATLMLAMMAVWIIAESV
jgi:tetrahydromethanopterin S-methyltransferase subunit C